MGGAINHSFISAHFLLSAYFLTVQTYKCMRLITQVYGTMCSRPQICTHTVNFRIPYSPENKPPPLFDFQVLAQVFEQGEFNCQSQLKQESVKQYITAPYSLTKLYNYGTPKDEMLQERIVVGIRETSLSERLKMEPNLMFKTAKKKVRQSKKLSIELDPSWHLNYMFEQGSCLECNYCISSKSRSGEI